MRPLSSSDFRNPRALGLLAAFILVVILVGGLVGVSNTPDVWYQGLRKPPFNPPNWVFAPVWLALYVLIAIAGWRTFLSEPWGARMGLWCGQMVLNWAWSPVWFSLHWLWPAFAIILAIVLLILAFIVASWPRDRLAAWLFVPYASWVAFAATLNFAVALLN
ncbi:MAG: tryptophan-rich sensory protein [Devosia sp.]|nr:tryptophan-rich sensory protein [Devosia sp.]